jgi:tetratricopeptide (TPR) repeat protein
VPRRRKRHPKPAPSAPLISEGVREQFFFLPATILLATYSYLKTMCPTVYVGDSGELTTAAYTLGIPHSPGYPLYCLIGYVFAHLPINPDIAFRMNLMSAFFAIGTVLMLYLIIYHFTRTPYLSFSVSLAYAFSPIFWSQAVTAEVYSLNTFLTAASLYCLCRWLEKRVDFWLFIAFFVMGLAVTNHQLSFLLLPTGIYLLILFGKGLKKTKRFWLSLALVYCAGLLVYLYLPIRASAHPALNWGNPNNLRDFVRTVFQPAGSQVSTGSRLQHFLYALQLWVDQFSPVIRLNSQDIPIPVIWLFGIWGIYKGLSTGWRMARVFVFFMVINVAAILFVSRPKGQEMMIVGVYYLPVFLIYAVFMATGIREWLQRFLATFSERKRPVFLALVILILILIPEYQLFQNWYMDRGEVNRANDYYARDYGTTLLTNCPGDSILLVNWDDIFTLWYLQKVEHVRPDVIIVIADFPTAQSANFWGDWIYKELMKTHPEIFDGTGIGTTPFMTREAAIDSFVVANLKHNRPVYFSFYGLGYDFNLLSVRVLPVGPVYRAGDGPFTLAETVVAKDKWEKTLMAFRNIYEYRLHRVGEEDFIISRLSTNLAVTGQLTLNHDPIQAVWFYDKARQIDPGNLEITLDLASLYIRDGDYEEAKSLLLSEQAVDPDNPDIHWYLALLYEKFGEKQLAFDELNQVLILEPKHPEARALIERLNQAQ